VFENSVNNPVIIPNIFIPPLDLASGSSGSVNQITVTFQKPTKLGWNLNGCDYEAAVINQRSSFM
jgi:hypothetical protein